MSAGTDPFGDPYERPEQGLHPVGWLIANLHSLLGHRKTAAFLGQDPGDEAACLICRYENYPSAANRQAVLRALAPGPDPP